MGGFTTHPSPSLLSLFSHLLLATLLLAAVGSVDSHGEKKSLALHQSQWAGNSPSEATSLQRSRTEKGATVLEMKHQYHFSGRIKSHDDHLWKKLIVSDEARVSSIQSQIKKAMPSKANKHSTDAQMPLTSGIKLQTLNYVVTIGLGGKNTTVIVDTGSDLTWVQCKPCLYCYNQQEPLYDPAASSSFHAIPCHSSTCDSLRAATGNSGTCGSDNSSCNYDLSYGDGSYTRGVLGQERIDLAGTSLENFIFGCGRSNRGLFGGTAGIMGLGRTLISLVSQTSSQFGGVFSYCMPTRLQNSSGSLVLGDDSSAYRNSSPISYTKLISDPHLPAPFYFLNLTGITVGGVALQASGFSDGKILIDSGTVITRVVPSIYKALKAEFVRQFSGYPSAPGFSLLDTCFNLSRYEAVKIPTLRLGFEGGVELNVDVTGIFYFVKKDASQVCLAIASLTYEDDVGIIGNYQQKNQRVVYDTKGSRLGFAKEACMYA